MTEEVKIAWMPLIFGVFGGLSLFLLGMTYMTDSLKTVAGSRVKRLLARITTSRFKAAMAGAFVTAAVQSSSVTTVLVVGLISANLMTLSQSVGIIMGANIGSTVTTQIIAFKVTAYGLPMVAIGFALQNLARRESWRYIGTLVLGLGLIFFGMDLMSDATRPLRSFPPFIEIMAQMVNPFLGIVAGTIFTAIIQSSAATTGLVIILAGQGLLPLEAGIAIAFGANIGTCATAILASLGKPREAVQAAIVHILFNVAGVLLWVWFIDPFADFIRFISPVAAEAGLDGLSKEALETPRQVANAHTIFNIVNTLLFLGFANVIATGVQKLLPVKLSEEERLAQPKYLDPIYLESPETSLDQVHLELVRLGELVLKMVQKFPELLISGSREELLKLQKMDDSVDGLHAAILSFLGRISELQLTNEQTHTMHHYVRLAQDIESMGDTIETNLVSLGLERQSQGAAISEIMESVLHPLQDKVIWAADSAFEALKSSNRELALEVVNAKPEINNLALSASKNLVKRLAGRDEDRLELFRIEADIIENLKRVYYFTKRLSREVSEG